MAKIMFFIDGTWVYYNTAKLSEAYGQQDFRLDFGKLPAVLAEALTQAVAGGPDSTSCAPISLAPMPPTTTCATTTPCSAAATSSRCSRKSTTTRSRSTPSTSWAGGCARSTATPATPSSRRRSASTSRSPISHALHGRRSRRLRHRRRRRRRPGLHPGVAVRAPAGQARGHCQHQGHLLARASPTRATMPASRTSTSSGWTTCCPSWS